MALPLETTVCNYPYHGIEIIIKHRHDDVAMIFMHQYIEIFINDWNGKEIYNRFNDFTLQHHARLR